jgi:hypothetical protein
LAHEEKAALPILEIDALLGVGQEIVHADEMHFVIRGNVFVPHCIELKWIDLELEHRILRSAPN